MSEHPFAYLRERVDVNDCCRNAHNLDVGDAYPGVLRARCRVCGRGHVKMVARGFLMSNLLRAMGEVRQTEGGLIVPDRSE